jgi:transposase InsO family protein
MDGSIEALKRVNLVELLSQYYGLEFKRQGTAFACCSPFTTESCPSFFVRQVGSHWLFKDFSSGTGGTIFDFVQMKEKLGSFSQAFSFLRRLLPSFVRCDADQHVDTEGTGDAPVIERPYDVDALYDSFCRQDPDVCRSYLLGRSISKDLVEDLIRNGTVVHNRYQGQSYCTFAVHDETGRLRCLDNHAVDGQNKFVLGEKRPFSLEWEELKDAKAVFVSEGIIDYLSVKTLEGERALPGLALLGNQLCFEAPLLEAAEVLHAAVDADRGGNSAILDLTDRYPTKELRVYDLEGHKDPNELLVAVRSGKPRTLSPQRKLELYREFQRSTNRKKLAEEWAIDRSYLYEIVRDCERTLVESLSSRKPGRRAHGAPANLEEAVEQIKELEARCEAEATQREESHCRSEFLALRLKWAEIEAAEARGEKVQEDQPPRKRQIKKKEKEETLHKIAELSEVSARLSRESIMGMACFSRSQLYRWQQGDLERKPRERKLLREETVENAAAVVATFPHFGGRKGQAYMHYHELGSVGMKQYEKIKTQVKRVLVQEVSSRNLASSPRESFEHERAKKPGEIWAEDFTEVTVEGQAFKVAVVIDTFDQLYLGAQVHTRPTVELVAQPIQQALEKTGGKAPEKFLLSDHGTQYLSASHEKLLSSAEIVHRCIPVCVPQYNGCVEGGMRDLKSVFYNVWERRKHEEADEEKTRIQRVRATLAETVLLLNESIPRPSLGGVTPVDVHEGRKDVKREEIQAYREQEESRPILPWARSYWDVLKSGVAVAEMTDGELQTKLAFFGRRPLRRIAKRNRGCVG